MEQTIDMKCMRHLNLFGEVSGVKSKNCFVYNSVLIFAVPFFQVSRAIGQEGRNVKKIAEILNRRIKVVALPSGKEAKDIERFIRQLISPLEFKSLETNQTEVIISADKQGKAVLIGRNKTRLFELQKIVREFFGKELRVV